MVLHRMLMVCCGTGKDGKKLNCPSLKVKIAYGAWKCMADKAVTGIKIVHWDNLFLKKGDNSASCICSIQLHML